jgi:hypothetical protein
MPIIIKTFDNLCQLIEDYPLSERKISEIQQGTINSILWNEDNSYPIAIDQNNSLTKFRQLIRENLYEFLEFAQQIDKNNEIQKSMKYLIILNDYRIKRQSVYDYFSQKSSSSENAISILNNIDIQQFHQLRLIALDLRKDFLKLIQFISPKFSLPNFD